MEYAAPQDLNRLAKMVFPDRAATLNAYARGFDGRQLFDPMLEEVRGRLDCPLHVFRAECVLHRHEPLRPHAVALRGIAVTAEIGASAIHPGPLVPDGDRSVVSCRSTC